MKTPSSLDPSSVAEFVGFPLRALHQVCSAIHRHYRQETRLIGSKQRVLRIPQPLLREIQYRVYHRLLKPLPIHQAAFCAPGRGVLKAARRHQRHRLVLHLDLKDFFPSVRPYRVRAAFAQAGFPPDTVRLLTRLTTYEGQLPQGASTSVAISNLVLWPLDECLWELCREWGGLTYTRYVDDIAISGGLRLRKAETLIRRRIARSGWKVGPKGGLLEGRDRRLLGVLVGNELTVDPSYVADLHSLLDELVTDSGSDEESLSRIAGRLAWVAAVNRDQAQPLEERLRTVLG